MADRSHTYRTRAVILRRRNYSDADRILTVFTPDLGKRLLIANGARKTSSRKAGHLELFTHANLLVAQARTWDIITESVTVESFLNLRTDLDNISRAAYVCELIDAFTEEEDDNQLLWELLLLCLRELHTGSSDGDLLLRWFDLHLLGLMGFQPQLFHCLGCGDAVQPVTNYLHLHAGGIYCPACGKALHNAEPIKAEVLKVLRHLKRTPWAGIHKLHLRLSTARALENILHRYLVHVLERRVKSVDFLNRLRRVPAAQPGSDA